MESPERGIAMEIPATDGAMSCSPPTMPPWLRRRLSESKTPPPSTVEEIHAKLHHADLRRQKFYESLSSKARPKPKSPSQSSHEDDLGQRLEAKLQAAEEKRLNRLTSAQMRLAKLDELRRAARAKAELRFRRKRAELSRKVELRVQQAEANRMLILKAYRQRRASLKERTSQSLLRRMARDSKYKERVRAAIYQKRAAAEKKRLGLLEAEKRRVHARIMQVRKVSKSVSYQREIEKREMKSKLEERLKKARRQRAEYLKQRGRQHNSTSYGWNVTYEQADILSRKLARCWKKFAELKKSTAYLARAFNKLDINERSVRSMPFEQFAMLIQSPATLRTSKSLLDRLESRYKISRVIASAHNPSMNDIDHLLKRVVSPKRGAAPRKAMSSRNGKKVATVGQADKTTAKLSRYQVRVVLCAYMILGHPDAVISGQGEREIALSKSAAKFVKELELLIRIILERPSQVSHDEPARNMTLRSQLAVFDSAWCSFLNSFVVWKAKDAKSLEEDLVRAACQLELSMIQSCKMTPDGDGGSLTHDMRAIQKQVTEDQNLLKEKVLHLSGDAGIERMETAIRDARLKFFQARENGSPITPLTPLMLSPNPASSSPLGSSDRPSDSSKEQSHVVRRLFKDEVGTKIATPAASSSTQFQNSGERLRLENVAMVNAYVHGEHLDLAGNSQSAQDSQGNIMAKIRETMRKAYWDGILESVQKDEPDYSRVIELTREVRDELCAMAPESWRQDITGAIDLDILVQVLNSGKLDMEFLGKPLDFALVTLRKLSAPAYEDELKEKHQGLLKELAETCWASSDTQNSHVTALVRGLRFVLEQIQELKQEISKARISILEPMLRGPAAFDFLQEVFTSQYGHPSNAMTALPLTVRWLTAVCAARSQEWEEHKNAIHELPLKNESSSGSFLPSTTLRTGGSLLVKTIGNQTDASSPANSVATLAGISDEYSKNKEVEIDLLVRLGLLKLVCKVPGLTLDELPETMTHNFSRLRDVQSRVQKIIVIATGILVLRQILLSQQIVSSQVDMEAVLSSGVRQLSKFLNSNADAGIAEVTEVLCRAVDGGKSMVAVPQSLKELLASMLVKSLQAEDTVFARVSHAVYLAARGVVLGGNGKQGIGLAEMALQRVGAALLLDELVEATSKLGLAAKVSLRVHGPWYHNVI